MMIDTPQSEFSTIRDVQPTPEESDGWFRDWILRPIAWFAMRFWLWLRGSDEDEF